MNKLSLIFVLVVMGQVMDQVLGHGMLLEPIARTSLWREDDSVLENYDDNGLFCGGRTVIIFIYIF